MLGCKNTHLLVKVMSGMIGANKCDIELRFEEMRSILKYCILATLHIPNK